MNMNPIVLEELSRQQRADLVQRHVVKLWAGNGIREKTSSRLNRQMASLGRLMIRLGEQLVRLETGCTMPVHRSIELR